MDIEVDQRCLGDVDVNPLREAILSQDATAWSEQLARQQTYEVHRDTESIVMLFCDESWPEGEIYEEAGWERLAETAMPMINHVIDTWYVPGGRILRAMAAKLKAKGKIQPHRDALHSFHIGHRIHIPITTNPSVRFMISGRPYHFEVGKVYELNNQRKHSVINMGSEDRITFIFDYVPPEKLPGDDSRLPE